MIEHHYQTRSGTGQFLALIEAANARGGRYAVVAVRVLHKLRRQECEREGIDLDRATFITPQSVVRRGLPDVDFIVVDEVGVTESPRSTFDQAIIETPLPVWLRSRWGVEDLQDWYVTKFPGIVVDSQ